MAVRNMTVYFFSSMEHVKKGEKMYEKMYEKTSET